MHVCVCSVYVYVCNICMAIVAVMFLLFFGCVCVGGGDVHVCTHECICVLV